MLVTEESQEVFPPCGLQIVLKPAASMLIIYNSVANAAKIIILYYKPGEPMWPEPKGVRSKEILISCKRSSSVRASYLTCHVRPCSLPSYFGRAFYPSIGGPVHKYRTRSQVEGILHKFSVHTYSSYSLWAGIVKKREFVNL